jgi:hypothetical protein
MSMFQLTALFFAGVTVASAVVRAAYWMYDKEEEPEGSRRRFRFVRIGAYFDLDLKSGTRPVVVCQKVTRFHYVPLSGPQKGDRVRASGDLPVYNVEDVP